MSDLDEFPEPILDDLFVFDDAGSLRLVAQRCGPDGVVLFPRQPRSVHCEVDELSDVLLSPVGELWSWTVARMDPPVMLGQVRFPEGPTVHGYLLGDLERPPRIGAAMETVPFVVTLPGSGARVTTHAFREVGSGA